MYITVINDVHGKSGKSVLYEMHLLPLALSLAQHDMARRHDVTCRWRKDWQSATVVNSTLVVDPTIQLPGFDLHRRQWSLLNHFLTGQGHCNACHKKWGFTNNELCDCAEIQTMLHIVNSCPWPNLTTALTWSRWGCHRLADNVWLLAHDNNNNCYQMTAHSNISSNIQQAG